MPGRRGPGGEGGATRDGQEARAGLDWSVRHEGQRRVVRRDAVSAALDRRSARGIVARAGDVLRREGFRALWFKILGETVYRRLVLVERPLALPVPDVAARVPVDVAFLQPTELAEYRAFRPETSEAELESRLRAGQICFVARHRGRMKV